ncbi:MAG: adenylate/guanylate cyclase domain-containing protein [Candidatus Cloacimonetes bacterium]|nr:adenylate/guanylate cyclase domain-containing protein [Candidatus Cloacimonadota bacterium]
MINKLIYIYILLLLTTINFGHKTFLQVEQNQVRLTSSQFLQYESLQDDKNIAYNIVDPSSYVKAKHIKKIANKYAVATTKFKDLWGISIQEELCSGLCAFELDLFVEKSAQMGDTLFLYSSQDVHERDTPFFINLDNIERDKWVKLDIWMPQYLPRVGNEPDFQISNPTRFKLEDVNSPLSPRALRAMRGLGDLTTTTGVFIHSISLKKSKLNLLNHDEQNTIKEALYFYPSHFETPSSIYFLILFFCTFTVLFIWKLQQKLGHKILLGFIIPIIFVTIFLLSLGMEDILSSVETSELYKVQQDLQADIFKVNNLGETIQIDFSQRLEKTIIPQIKKLISTLRTNNVSLKVNQYGKANSKYIYDKNKHKKLAHFKIKDTLDLQLNSVVSPHKLNIILANEDVLFFSNDYYVEKGVRHIATIFQKYIQNELKDKPNKNGRQQIEAIREIITNALNSSKTFDKFINTPSLPVRLQKHSIEGATSANKVFWTYFLEEHEGRNIVWLIFGGIEKQALQSTLSRHLDKLYKAKQHSFDEFLFLGDNLLGIISNNKTLDSELLEVSSYAKNNRSLTFFPKITNKKLYFYNYHMYEPSLLYSFVLRKSGDEYLKNLQSTKNYIYYSIFALFASILLCSYVLSLLVIQPMSQLSQGMLKIEQEDLNDDLKSTGKDQFSEVSRLLNQVLISLREKEHLSKFLSNMVLNSLDSEQFTSSRQDQYIMFCGIQNLKSLEQEFGLEKVVSLIDLFLQDVQEIIVKYNGRIDKFTGKSSLSIFDSKSDPNDIIQVLIDLKGKLTTFAKIHSVKIDFGVGLAKGSVVLGHVGAKQRKDFTAIGSTVNKAARLEALASKTTDQTNIYFDQVCFDIFQKFDHFDYKLCESVHLKGYQKEQSVYELL